MCGRVARLQHEAHLTEYAHVDAPFVDGGRRAAAAVCVVGGYLLLAHHEEAPEQS